jgi:hypothetical protein
MKPTKILFCAAMAGVIVLAASKASAVAASFPLVKLGISGTFIYSPQDTNTSEWVTNDTGTVTKGVPIKKVSFNTQKLIDLLNASPEFKRALTNEFSSVSSNQVPAGSYFAWDFWNEELIITNKNGFSFNLDNNVVDDDFGYLDFWDDYLFGNFTRNDTTGAGTESDLTGIYLYFYDYNGNEIETYGSAKLNWSYGALSGGLQKTTLKASIKGSAASYGEVNFSYYAAPTFSASGSGTGSDPGFQFPFYIWDY